MCKNKTKKNALKRFLKKQGARKHARTRQGKYQVTYGTKNCREKTKRGGGKRRVGGDEEGGGPAW